MVKIETHLHTKYSSHCGRLDEKEMITAYKKAGYSGIVVTDHYNRATFQMKGIDLHAPGDKVTPFLEGYYRMKEEGEKLGIRIYKGAELRFDSSENDYLLINYSDSLLADPWEIFTAGLSAFAKKYRSDGAMLIQAHPYRTGCTPANPAYLDGAEILNMHPTHKNHNHLAKEFAEKYHLIGTSGSDCHETSHIARGGILTDALPEDEAALAMILKSGEFRLIGQNIL